MQRRKFTRDFKLEAVRLIRQRGVSFVQASWRGPNLFSFRSRVLGVFGPWLMGCRWPSQPGSDRPASSVA